MNEKCPILFGLRQRILSGSSLRSDDPVSATEPARHAKLFMIAIIVAPTTMFRRKREHDLCD